MRDVFLIHGLSAPGWIMKPMCSHLKRSGLKPHILTYPSRSLTIDQAADFLWQKITKELQHCKHPAAIVTHSLGGLVAQTMLARYQPKNIATLIMIAPPNHGVELVSFFQKRWWTRWILYIAGALPTHQLERCNQPKAPNIGKQYPCHLILGKTSKTISGQFIPGENDGIVSKSSALIPHLASTTTLPYEHLVLVLRKKTAKTIIKHLKKGV